MQGAFDEREFLAVPHPFEISLDRVLKWTVNIFRAHQNNDDGVDGREQKIIPVRMHMVNKSTSVACTVYFFQLLN